MNAVIMDNAVIGESAIVAACAFVKAGVEIPPRSLAAGMPARVIRALAEDEIAWKVEGTRTYQEPTRRCLATMVECDPPGAAEPDRPRIHMPDVIPIVELKRRGDQEPVSYTHLDVYKRQVTPRARSPVARSNGQRTTRWRSGTLPATGIRITTPWRRSGRALARNLNRRLFKCYRWPERTNSRALAR